MDNGLPSPATLIPYKVNRVESEVGRFHQETNITTSFTCKGMASAAGAGAHRV